MTDDKIALRALLEKSRTRRESVDAPQASARSRTIARGTTMLAEPPKAASARKAEKLTIPGASAQPAEAAA